MKKFYFKLTNNCIEVKQLGYRIFEIPYDSITRLYIYKSPLYKLLNVSGLAVEFGKENTLKEQLLFGGPKSRLNDGIFSPGISGDYLTLPYMDLSDAERIKHNILEKCVVLKPEVKYIGMLHP